MVIMDDRDLNLEFLYEYVGSRVKPTRKPDRIQAFLQIYREIEKSVTHTQLRDDLIEHVPSEEIRQVVLFFIRLFSQLF
jgi:hypothetical protein